MDVLNNREWALVFWAFLVVIYIVTSPKMSKVRPSIGRLIHATFAKSLVRAYFIISIYVLGIVLLLNKYGLWGTHQIKNTLVWFFTVGIYSAFQVEKIKEDKKYLKRLVFDSFKLIAILQFITNIQPLSFVAELLIAPILFVITLASVIAGKDKKFEVISKVINSLLVMFGLFILAKSLYFIISSFSTLDIEKIAYDFFTPPLLTLLYIPFLFFLMLYSTFDYAFTRVNVNIKKPYLRVFSKVLAVFLFNIRSELVERWGRHLGYSRPQTIKDTLRSFSTIFQMKKAEGNPKKIPKAEGWSPYIEVAPGICTSR